MYNIYIADIRSNCAYNGMSTGHFIPVAKMYQRIFADNVNVLVVGGPVFKKHFKDEELLVLPYNVSGDGFIHKLKTFANCFKLIKAAKGQTIILQQSTDVTTHIALSIFYHGGSNLYMIRYSNAGLSSRFKRFVYGFCKHKIDGIICPNDEVGRAYDLPYIVVPDYIYIGEAEIPSIPFEERYYDFCIVGRLSPEKGVPDAIKALRETNYKVLIAGKPQSEALGKEIQKECEGADNIELHLGYINDGDYFRYIHQSRYSVLNYQGEYSVRSSGVVYDMLFNGTPVVGCRCKSLKFIEEKGLGQICDDINNVDFSKLMDIEFYNWCQNNIIEYRKSHQMYKDKLRKFILGK